MIKSAFLYTVNGRYFCYGNEITRSQYEEYRRMDQAVAQHKQNVDRAMVPNDPIMFATLNRPRNHSH